MDFHSCVEFQSSKKLKILRSDNGRKYITNRFKQYCLNYGIIHQTSCLQTPERNGIFKRKHKDLLKTTRALLINCHSLPHKYWVEVLPTTTFLINRMPIQSYKTKLIFNYCSKLQATINYLKLSAASGFRGSKPHQKSKLEPQSKTWFFFFLIKYC